MTTLRGFRQAVHRGSGGRAEVVADEDGVDDGWYKAVHPMTGNILQLAADGSVSVHTEAGSWSSYSNRLSTLTEMWGS